MGYLSDVVRRRIAALLLLAAIAVAALAIADAGPFEDPPTIEEEAQAAVERLFAAAAEGDFEAYCDLLTGHARRLVRVNAARLLRKEDVGGCPTILSAFGEALEGGTLRVRQVSVSGEQARAEVDYRVPGGRGPQPRTVFLQLVDGAWRVNDPG